MKHLSFSRAYNFENQEEALKSKIFKNLCDRKNNFASEIASSIREVDCEACLKKTDKMQNIMYCRKCHCWNNHPHNFCMTCQKILSFRKSILFTESLKLLSGCFICKKKNIVRVSAGCEILFNNKRSINICQDCAPVFQDWLMERLPDISEVVVIERKIEQVEQEIKDNYWNVP